MDYYSSQCLNDNYIARQNKYKKMTLDEAKKILKDNNYLVEYIAF